MGPVIKLIQAIARLTQAGSIKKVEDAYRLAKRELGERFGQYKEIVKDAFNEGKRKQTLDKRTKDIKKTEESGIKSIDVDEKGLTDSPLDDLERIVKGEDPPAPTAKEMTEKALAEITKKKSLGTMSQEAMIRSAVREFLSRRLKDGTLTIPDAGDRDAIERFTQGADPIDVFRKAYGEDAIGGVAGIQDDYGDMLQRAGTFDELGDTFEKLFFRESDGGLRYNTKPKPVDKYGFDPGLMSLEETERLLRKDLKEKQMLEDLDITDREPNAAGGLMRTSYAVGSGIKLAVFLARKGKDLMTEIKKAVDNIISSGDSKVDADVAIDDMLDDLEIDRSVVDQKDVMDAYGKAYNMLVKEKGLMSTKVPGGMTPKSSPIATETDNLKAMGAPKLAERFELKQKYPGISDDLVDKILIDDNPQRKAEVLASIDEAFKMMEKGKDPDEIVNIMKNTPRTKNATGGRVLAASGGLADILKV